MIINKSRAKDIQKEVCNSVKRWQMVAQSIEVSRAEQEQMRQAFKFI